jgi:hypothetical protein
VTAEPPEVPERGPKSEGRIPRVGRLQIRHVVLVAGIIAAAGIGGFLWLSGDNSPGAGESADAPEAVVAEQGVACPHLYEAFTHRQAGDAEALRRSVDTAAQVSEQALQQSGRAFGRSEEIAIELQYVLTETSAEGRKDAQALLAKARELCERLGRWTDSA